VSLYFAAFIFSNIISPFRVCSWAVKSLSLSSSVFSSSAMNRASLVVMVGLKVELPLFFCHMERLQIYVFSTLAARVHVSTSFSYTSEKDQAENYIQKHKPRSQIEGNYCAKDLVDDTAY
jgi:hypothetical protein